VKSLSQIGSRLVRTYPVRKEVKGTSATLESAKAVQLYPRVPSRELVTLQPPRSAPIMLYTKESNAVNDDLEEKIFTFRSVLRLAHIPHNKPV
jgi:hypothetical protein